MSLRDGAVQLCAHRRSKLFNWIQALSRCFNWIQALSIEHVGIVLEIQLNSINFKCFQARFQFVLLNVLLNRTLFYFYTSRSYSVVLY